jgi:hypothetical protein
MTDEDAKISHEWILEFHNDMSDDEIIERYVIGQEMAATPMPEDILDRLVELDKQIEDLEEARRELLEDFESHRRDGNDIMYQAEAALTTRYLEGPKKLRVGRYEVSFKVTRSLRVSDPEVIARHLSDLKKLSLVKTFDLIGLRKLADAGILEYEYDAWDWVPKHTMKVKVVEG